MGKYDKTQNIELLKKELSNLISNGLIEEDYKLSNEQKAILDSFFEQTNQEVIEKILLRTRERLLYDKTINTVWKKNHFKVSSLAIIFPDCHHSSTVLSYLENRYRDKFSELGLYELGLVSYDIVRAQGFKNDSFYTISYSNPSDHMKCRYSLYCYVLEVTFSISKKKNGEKIKVKNYN